MLNRAGGDILLGVADDGTVLGVNEVRAAQLLKEIANLSNNPQKLHPPFILLPQAVAVDGKKLLHIQVPESSQVHKSKGVVYDRSEDGDYKLTNHTAIAELYTRKSVSYSENTIYPYLRFSDFKPELFPKIRNLIRSRDYTHPWLELDDEQLLRKAGLYRRDSQTGKEGYTLAAALLLGEDEVIQSILPQYKTDALLRRHNLDRYDDRLYVQTNLIDAYDQLMAFIAKHLSDKFFLEGAVRVSLRSKIFREVVANLLVHREFTNGSPARLFIYKDKVVTENANRPHTYGRLLPDNFSPYAKNPVIAKFFTQLGHVDELGSGILNVNKYLPFYTPGQLPVFDEGDMFRITIPLEAQPSGGVNKETGGVFGGVFGGVNDTAKMRWEAILNLLSKHGGLKASQIAEETGLPKRTVERDLGQLKEQEMIIFKGSPKTGGYFLKDAEA